MGMEILNYKISENVKLFTIPLSQDEYNSLIEETEKMRESIIVAWAIKYTNYNLFINTTCTSCQASFKQSNT